MPKPPHSLYDAWPDARLGDLVFPDHRVPMSVTATRVVMSWAVSEKHLGSLEFQLDREVGPSPVRLKSHKAFLGVKSGYEHREATRKGGSWLCTHSFRSMRLLSWVVSPPPHRKAGPQEAPLPLWVPSTWVLATLGREKLTVTSACHSWDQGRKRFLLRVPFYQLKK